MDRKTLLAVVISVVIIVGGMLLQSVLFPQKPPAPQTAAQSTAPATTPAAGAQGSQPAGQQPAQTVQATPAPAPASSATTLAVPGKVVPLPDSAPAATASQTITRDTDLYSLAFSRDGGTLTSVKLKKYKNVDGSLVDMILPPRCRARMTCRLRFPSATTRRTS